MNVLQNVMVVGLTGQTGSGKSTVSRVFAESGFALIDADSVTKFIQPQNSPCLAELEDFFGKEIISENGSLDRKKLSEIVFSKKSRLEALNAICYPYICSEILKRIRKYARMNKKIILLDAPTLFESRTDDFCELIISVISRENLRLERIMKRDGIDETMAKKRMHAQKTQKFFIENSDFIIKNNKSMENLESVAKEVAEKIWDYYNKNY